MACDGSTTKRRPDRVRSVQLDAFLGWLMSGLTQREAGTSGRSFRRQHTWCWNVEPVIAVTGVVYDEIQLDGTYLAHGWCLLSAVDGASGDVIDWQWCNRESAPAWTALLERIAAPRVVVIDGGTGLASALAACWADARVQRCLVHVQRDIRRHVTMNPRTDAGKALRNLSLTLTRIKTRQQATDWLVALNDFDQTYRTYLDERTNASDPGAVRPTTAKAGATWWYTHERARKARNLLTLLAKRGHLFTYLREEFDALGISSTTNRIEGGANAQIKNLLRDHRGMTSDHQRRAIDWWCYMHSPGHAKPSSLIRPEHWQPAPPRPVSPPEEIPGDWGTAVADTYDDFEGVHIRKGWAGRN